MAGDEEESGAPSSAELRVLLSKRDSLFSILQGVLDYSKKITSKDASSLTTLRMKIKSLELVRESFMEVVERINVIEAQSSSTFTPNFRPVENFLEMYSLITAAAEELARLLNARQRTLSPLTPRQDDSSSGSPVKVKLPTLDLPTFSGESASEWLIFYELFKAMIHDRQDLSNAQKCQYLLSRLSGRALSCCSSIPATPDNYPIIFQALIDKYNDKRVLTQSYLDAMFNFKSVKTESVTSLNNFIEKFGASVSAIKALNLDDLGDTILVYMAMSKLSPDTVKSFEMTLKKDELPTFDKIMGFVKEHTKMLARVQSSSSVGTATSTPSSKVPLTSKSKVTHTFFSKEPSSLKSKAPAANCLFCHKNSHPLFRCERFHSLTPRDRYNFVRNNNRCLNCLSEKHGVRNCPSKTSCSKCSRGHHTLLHFPSDKVDIGNSKTQNSGCQTEVPVTKHVEAKAFCSTSGEPIPETYTVLLGTIKTNVYGDGGKPYVGRFLLDSGSQSNFVTAKFCEKIGMVPRKTDCVVSGLESSTRPVQGKISINLESRIDNSFSYPIDALVIKSITHKLPTAPICAESIPYLRRQKLADDTFDEPGEIDGLIGAALYPHLLLSGHIQGSNQGASALNTTFGFVVVGSAKICGNPSQGLFCGFVENNRLETLVERFWESEDIGDSIPLHSADEIAAENHFQNTFQFDSSQKRYRVRLPFKHNPDTLGSSYDVALRRFFAIEKKLDKLPKLKSNYHQGIRDLLESNQLDICDNDDRKGFYVPHHVVIKESSLTTKYRIVFDFSCSSDNGLSLNDVVHSGPKLYNDLFSILLNFRLFKIALVADISKMFLQILLDKEDCRFQKIFWRFSTSDPIQVYLLNRVTFGLKSSPFLSQRVIRQLAIDKAMEYPLVKPIVNSAFYMDDLTTSVPVLEEALETQRQLVSCFKSASFDLVKWASNSPEVLERIPKEDCLLSLINWDSQESMKILGMGWSHISDEFSFSVDVETRPCTKRVILSDLAKIWDPLGLINPVTLHCKAILQYLWNLKLSWDDPAPADIAQLWQQILAELKLLADIRIPRHIEVVPHSDLTILGFCDASERACGAVVYTRTVAPDGRIVVSLLCAKSKVAPLKKVSIPRLELNAALLLARLIHLVRSNYEPRYPVSNIMCFSDSTVALHWINASPHKWQTYVANRVTKVQELVPPEQWFHISGQDNASADCLSRGLTPSQLLSHPTWFSGPAFLQDDPEIWPVRKFQQTNETIPEEKAISLITTSVQQPHFFLDLVQRTSSWNKLLNIIVYICRFLKLLPSSSHPVDISDLAFAERKLWLAVQKKHFKEITSQNKLTPFVDSDGLIRVGGRLNLSNLSYEQKHPLLLPKNEPAVKLLINHLHRTNLHTGPSLLLAILRQNYWVVAARPLVRKIVQSCNHCFKLKPRSTTPLMAPLPKYRVEEVKPFVNSGVDFAGPLQITFSRHRGVRSQKAYLCLFICLTTKAIHLELVSDLTKEAFVNAFKRFISRRGPICTLYSDNGTNMVGSKNMLNDMYGFLASSGFQDSMSQAMVQEKIQWKMLPPSSPHMAGIWERAIRSCKTHLYKAIGDQILTYEELSTVLVQIEALLNSRPLCVLSGDPNDPEALTPAHFLKLTPLQHLPVKDYSNTKINRLTRFQLLDQLVSSFWVRWRNEYLNSLQERSKWDKTCPPIAVGTVVLLREDNIPPLHWKLGVVSEVFPGSDKVVRVANVRTISGVYKRPVVKLCPLPTQ